MSFYTDFFDKMASAAEQVKPYASIVYGSDPPKNGICMYPTGGIPVNVHFDKGSIVTMPVLLNGKHEDQHLLIDTLTAIHEVLTKRLDYSDLSTEAVQITDIKSISLPVIISREQNKQWVSGSTLEVSFYWKAVDYFTISI